MAAIVVDFATRKQLRPIDCLAITEHPVQKLLALYIARPHAARHIGVVIDQLLQHHALQAK